LVSNVWSSESKHVFDKFYLTTSASATPDVGEISATAKTYSDGRNLIIEVDVIDDSLYTGPGKNSDRIEIWLGQNSFTSENSADDQSTTTPHFGKVHYILFPDKRQTQQVFEDQQLLEQNLGTGLGNTVKAVRYVTTPTANGYKLMAVFTPVAMGFVVCPKLTSINVRIDVIDVDHAGQSELTLSSGNPVEDATTDMFQNILLQKPIPTNFSSIATNKFDNENFAPVLLFNERNRWSAFKMSSPGIPSEEVGKLELQETEQTN